VSRGRYAPSPTGSLHLGNARTALVAWLRARSQGASFVLRVEDLDEPRTVAQAVEGNLHELAWLGLDWDEGPDVGGPHAPYRQSERHHLYEAALARLTRQGLIFECYLSRRELRELSSAPHGQAPVYGEAQRRLNERVVAEKRAQGKQPALRLRVEPGELKFEDAFLGPQRFDALRDVGDIVLRRADGAWAYQLAVVVDDIAMGIEEVVRGADLLPSTAAQLLLYRRLGAKPPRFAHVPLLLDETGERMAKRRGSLTLESLRSAGIDPGRVVGLLAHSLGLLPERRPVTPQELAQHARHWQPADAPHRLTRTDLEWLSRG